MDKKERDEYIRRYTERFKETGYSPETLGWGKNGRQELRFSILSQDILANPGSSVLDVGCGFGDLFSFLRKNGWKGNYTGIDIVPVLIETAKKNHEEGNFILGDLLEIDQEKEFDFVVASGIFNAKLVEQDNISHISMMLQEMFKRTGTQMCIDFMSSYVDFMKPGAWHTDPAWVLGYVAKNLSRRFVLRYDYMPFEFTVKVFKSDKVNAAHVFEGHKNDLI